MKLRIDRSHHRDIRCLNIQYIKLLKGHLDSDVISGDMFKCRHSAIQTIRELDQTQPIAACNVLQYKIAMVDSDSRDPDLQGFHLLLRDTLLFYREISKTTPKHAANITGLRADIALEFASLSYSQIDERATSNKCQLQMRFFESYWERVRDIASDSPASLQLITAAQAANETYSNKL